jgi:hypothetical protein
VLVGKLSSHLHGLSLPAGFSASDVTPATLSHLTGAVRDGFVAGYAESIQTVFLVAVPIAAIAFLASWLIPQLELRSSAAPATTAPAATATADAGAEVNGARVNGAEANGANVNGAEANGARINGVEVSGARVNGAEANGARVNGARVNGVEAPATGVNGAEFPAVGDAGRATSHESLDPQDIGHPED